MNGFVRSRYVVCISSVLKGRGGRGLCALELDEVRVVSWLFPFERIWFAANTANEVGVNSGLVFNVFCAGVGVLFALGDGVRFVQRGGFLVRPFPRGEFHVFFVLVFAEGRGEGDWWRVWMFRGCLLVCVWVGRVGELPVV